MNRSKAVMKENTFFLEITWIKEASLVSYCGSRLVSWDSSRLLLSVMVCLVEAAARWLSKARISCFSRWEI